MTLRVGIYVYDQVEVLDFAGPYEVFSTATRVAARLTPGMPAPFTAALIAREARLVSARAGLEVRPNFTIDDHPPLDVLLVPGGVHDGELARGDVIAWISRQHATTRLTASVCTGAFLLAAARLLDGLEVTTHWEDCADLARAFPEVVVREGVRWIEHERVVTSAGISAGLDMSLRLVARLAGDALASATARQMDYAWRSDPR